MLTFRLSKYFCIKKSKLIHISSVKVTTMQMNTVVSIKTIKRSKRMKSKKSIKIIKNIEFIKSINSIL